MIEKFFNTAGPINPDIHYNINPLHRIELEEIEMLIRQQKYFVLHAPRQTGKTSCLLALRNHLNAQQQYWTVYANVEAGQAMRENIKEVVRIVCEVIANETALVTGTDLSIRLLAEVLPVASAGNLLTTYLSRLCNALDRPLILFLDEIDSLVGDSLVSILRQIRSGYTNRPQNFPQTIILCGVRDVRDYRIVTSNKDIVTGGSAFNIKATSLRLGNFNREEIQELYLQHTAVTGQEFDPECFPMIWNATEGQPWLVNALGYEVTQEMRENRDRSIRIIPEMIYRAQERIIYRRDTHIDILIDKLREDRVRRVIVNSRKENDMTTSMELEAQKALLVRDILTEFNDKDTLKQLRDFVERILKTKNTEIQKETISKKELLAGIDAGLKEVKQTMEGKLECKTAREFLNEL